MKDWKRGGIWLGFALFACVIVLSNFNDWDQFLSFFEVELRSWMSDFRPPMWSYQLCGGVTRIGDPQSFGLSPLFLPAILLGSFWGTKALAIICLLLGYRYLIRLMDLLDPVRDASSPWIHRSLSFFYFTGNYFLWHLHSGHMTFTLIPFLMVPLFYAIKGALRGLGRRESILFGLSSFAYCTAGFYHSLVFFVLPSILIGAVVAVFSSLSGDFPVWPFLRRHRRTIKRTVGVAAVAVVLSSYKWLEVLHYQLVFPRVLSHPIRESSSLLRLATYFLVPTWKYNFAGFFHGWGPWEIYENSAFSWTAWVALILSGFSLCRKGGGVWGRQFALGLLLAIAFCLGDSSPLPVYPWLNRHLFHQSVRGVGRYEIVFLFILTVFLFRFLCVRPRARRVYAKYLAPIGLVLAVINITSFFEYTDWGYFRALLAKPVEVPAQMTSVVIVPDRKYGLPGNSFMYPAIRLGGIVLNCYEPLSRSYGIASETSLSPVLPVQGSKGVLSLLHPGSKPISDACRQSASVTQNDVRLDRNACPDDLCFHLNALNLYWHQPLVWNPGRGLFCVKGS